MKEAFITKKFKEETIQLIAHCTMIIEDYVAQGYSLTLRQLYYQLVTKNVIPNNIRSYKRLGNVVSDARLAGLLDWSAIEDLERKHSYSTFQETQVGAMRGLEYGIRYDYWERQETYLEVWVEKNALKQVIQRACDPFDVTTLSCKGYLSSSAAYRAGKRFDKALRQGKRCVLIHLGDHDPSGIDMTRDNRERVHMFANKIEGEVEVERIALNYEQIEEYAPPPNPTKQTDSRAGDYMERFDASWELDALEPSVLNRLITDQIESYIDWDIWSETEAEEEEAREPLIAVRENWHEVEAIIRDRFL